MIYTGKENRTAMSQKKPHEKIGLLDIELNFISKLLFLFLSVLAIVVIVLRGI